MNIKYYLEPQCKRVLYKVDFDCSYQYEYIALDNYSHSIVDFTGTLFGENKPTCECMPEETMYRFGEDDPWFPFPIERFNDFIEISGDVYEDLHNMFTDTIDEIRDIISQSKMTDLVVEPGNCFGYNIGTLFLCEDIDDKNKYGQLIYYDESSWLYEAKGDKLVHLFKPDYCVSIDCFDRVLKRINKANEDIVSAFCAKTMSL